MAQPFDALAFREIFGRTLRNRENGRNIAYWVTPFGSDHGDGLSEREFSDRVSAVLWSMRNIIEDGEIFYVSAEITAMLLDTARQLPDNKVMHFEPGDFPTRMGYVYFDGHVPMPTLLAREGSQPLRALMWGQLLRSRNIKHSHWLVPGSDSELDADVVGKVVYSVVDNPAHWRSRQIERVMDEKIRAGRWATRHWFPVEYDVRMDPNMAAGLMEKAFPEYFTDEEAEQDNAASEESIRLMMKVLYTWVNFAQTELVSHHRFDSSNHDRVMAREGRPPAKIRVITLRRYAAGPDPEVSGTVDWTHRWKVREHYRWQKVGPGRTFIRRVLVREHVKGPADRPLAEQDTIQAFVR